MSQNRSEIKRRQCNKFPGRWTSLRIPRCLHQPKEILENVVCDLAKQRNNSGALVYRKKVVFGIRFIKKKGHQMLRYDVVKHQLKPLHVSSIPEAGSSEIHHNNLAIKKVKKV